MPIHIALALALAETVALALVLLAWAPRVPGAKLLVVFLLGVATWVVGNELPNWAGLHTAPLALALLATVPLTAAAFLHFCAIFCALPLSRPLLALAYGAGGAATLLSIAVTPGRFERFEPFSGFEWSVVPNAAGWVTSLVWATLAGAGIWRLFCGWWQSESPQRRRQIAAVGLSCAWGLLCMSGFAFAALQWPLYPWQVLGFPAYPVILVYGILRYQVFVANAWARRALAWTILLAVGVGVVSLTLALPFESRWLSGLVVAATSLALSGPVRRLAERVVYPGGTPSADDLVAWREALSSAPDAAALRSRAAELLSRRLGLQVEVRITESVREDTTLPTLVCVSRGAGWQVDLLGFDAAPPGPRHLAELFGAVLADAAAHVAAAVAAEQRERDRQLQARLAELGALAATVAHDLRNPLNIIAMAVATTPQEVRVEVGDQVRRISRLAEDLLDYAKPWQLQPVLLDLGQHLRELARRTPEVELGPGLQAPLRLRADPMRLDQAVGNLLSNARAAAGGRRVMIDAQPHADGIELQVCDDGPGVPAELRERLFEPFVSRSPGGTGLGLAIVARIMAAHNGTVALTERPPWRTCFTLRFPHLA